MAGKILDEFAKLCYFPDVNDYRTGTIDTGTAAHRPAGEGLQPQEET
jgi:hypothetical protein